MNKCTEHKFIKIQKDEVNWESFWTECEYCGDKKRYNLDSDNATLLEPKGIEVSPSYFVVNLYKSKDRWCEWDCGAILTKPFITVDDRVMCKECAKEYNQEKGW